MMNLELHLNLDSLEKHSKDKEILREVESTRATALKLLEEERQADAFERTVEALRLLRSFSDFENEEFNAMLVALLFDLAQIHYSNKDFKQAERHLETLFKVLSRLIHSNEKRFGPFHILAMELSTKILRSRRKTLDVLAKQQAVTYQLLSKVNSGVSAATDRLVDSLRKTAQLLTATGDYRTALKFYAEAIKYSKRRSGKVTRKEVKMTIEMAEVMMRIRAMRPRAMRLLNAVLPHAIALETIELEEDILALLEVIQTDVEQEPRWKAFLHRLSHPKSADKKQPTAESAEAAASARKGSKAKK